LLILLINYVFNLSKHRNCEDGYIHIEDGINLILSDIKKSAEKEIFKQYSTDNYYKYINNKLLDWLKSNNSKVKLRYTRVSIPNTLLSVKNQLFILDAIQSTIKYNQ